MTSKYLHQLRQELHIKGFDDFMLVDEFFNFLLGETNLLSNVENIERINDIAQSYCQRALAESHTHDEQSDDDEAENTNETLESTTTDDFNPAPPPQQTAQVKKITFDDIDNLARKQRISQKHVPPIVDTSGKPVFQKLTEDDSHSSDSVLQDCSNNLQTQPVIVPTVSRGYGYSYHLSRRPLNHQQNNSCVFLPGYSWQQTLTDVLVQISCMDLLILIAGFVYPKLTNSSFDLAPNHVQELFSSHTRSLAQLTKSDQQVHSYPTRWDSTFLSFISESISTLFQTTQHELKPISTQLLSYISLSIIQSELPLSTNQSLPKSSSLIISLKPTTICEQSAGLDLCVLPLAGCARSGECMWSIDLDMKNSSSCAPLTSPWAYLDELIESPPSSDAPIHDLDTRLGVIDIQITKQYPSIGWWEQFCSLEPFSIDVNNIVANVTSEDNLDASTVALIRSAMAQSQQAQDNQTANAQQRKRDLETIQRANPGVDFSGVKFE